MGKLRTVLNSVLEHQLHSFLGGFPPWSNVATGRLTTEVCEHSIGFVQDDMLLFQSHGHRVLMRVTMQSALLL